MHHVEPVKSYGEHVTATYDQKLRGDEAETVTCVSGLPATAPGTFGRDGRMNSTTLGDR